MAQLGNFFSRFVIHMLASPAADRAPSRCSSRWIGAWAPGHGRWRWWVSLLLISLRDVAVPYWEKARQSSATLFGFLEERLVTTEDLRANGATAYVLRRLAERSRELVQREPTAMVAVRPAA